MMSGDRRRWRRAALVGGLLALIPYLWMINAGRFDPFARQPLGDFYDAQAHSLLEGRLDVPPEVLKVEAFENDGRTYMYFGPMPAVLRLPVAAVTDDLDGRLTQTSMTLGVVVAMIFASRLHRRLRSAVRGDRPLTRAELIGTGGFTFAVGAGSSLLYVANTPIIYHEAITWGVAASLAAFDALLAWRDDPTSRRLAVLTALITVALLTRSSVGGGPLAALALFAALDLGRRRLDPASALRLGAAILLPVVIYCGVNVAKFDSLFSVPFQSQGINELRADRTEVLEANDGTIFGVRFLPSTVLQFTRPDAVGIAREFPYIDFPAPARVIGDVTFDDIERSSSVPATMPLWVALATLGLFEMVRRPSLRRVAVPVIGALAGVVVTLTIGYIGQRYTADAVPSLVIAGSVGLHALLGRDRRWILPILSALLAVTVLVVFSLGLRYQREWGFLVDEDLRAELVRFQYGDAPALGTLPEPGRGSELPGVVTHPGQLFVIGDCAALYFAKDETWEPVERMPEGGRFVMDLTLPADFERSELVSTLQVSPTTTDRGEAAFELRHASKVSEPIRYVPGEPTRLDVVVDWRIGFVTVTDDEDRILFEPFYVGPRQDAVVNRDFPGDVALIDREPTACRAVTGP